MATARAIAGHRRYPLRDGWALARVRPGAAADPGELAELDVVWEPAQVPGTVASARRAAGTWDMAAGPVDFDADDWWYTCRFAEPAAAPDRPVFLNAGGLATVADVWLNGHHLLHSDNMFLAHEADVSELLRPPNELVMRFRSLHALPQTRRPRPRWRTRLVDNQGLRWVRTTLLGRMPGWSPPAAAVGPWRPVWLEQRASLTVRDAELRAHPGATGGTVEVMLRVAAVGNQAAAPVAATLVVGAHRAPLRAEPTEDGSTRLHGAVRVPDAALWWPHTHGPQPLYSAAVVVRLRDTEVAVDLGRVGFRSVDLAGGGDGEGFELVVNGVRVFCRGACWTPPDVVSLSDSSTPYRAALAPARAAGMNMLRVSGTMVYEADAFYDLCDEMGLMVWQDFMFANMDYPAGDAAFVASVRAEAAQQVGRLQPHPCLALLCGNSEVEQQAAMLGLPPESWRNALFQEVLPEACAALRPDVPYWPSSPGGGTPPFRVDVGVAHYYGVGAYQRPLEDARRAGVRFASECLAFANVPEDTTLDLVFGDERPSVQHPAWKARVPRDRGAGWDFDDVRDYYLELLFGLDSRRLRYTDPDRYLALSRVTTGEVMASAFAEWRQRLSTCRGGLVWFYRDLWPGAGWGVLDSTGQPKAAYYYVKRVLQPVALLISDEGLNGLRLHVVNDTAEAVQARVRLSLYRHGQVLVASASRGLPVPARGGATVDAEQLLGAFRDTTYAYRFGPASHDVAVATATDAATGHPLGEAFHFPQGLPSTRQPDVGLVAEAEPLAQEGYAVTLRTTAFAQAVSIRAEGFRPEDNYFHLEPGAERTVFLHATAPGRPLVGAVQALNAYASAAIVARGAGQAG